MSDEVVSERLATTERSDNAMEDVLIAALSFLEDGHGRYTSAKPTLRRSMNQALFKRVYVEASGDHPCRARREPFNTLLVLGSNQ